jgi:hypothetical protein
MSNIDNIINEIKKVYFITDSYAVSSFLINNPIDIDYYNLGEFGCKISRKLNMDNWYIGTYDNYIVIEINDKYIIVYFEHNILKNTIEIVTRRCNNNKEYIELKLAIS